MLFSDLSKHPYLVPEGSHIDLNQIPTDDLSLVEEDLDKKEADKKLKELLLELRQLQKVLYAQGKHKVLVVIQAMDTGGKDGTVKSVFSTVDPQGIHVQSFKKPNAEELGHDFLWRIHQHAPAKGQITVFNRSHYEDIIAVRVKKIFEDQVWKKRYRHVVDFEHMLAEEGTIIIKLFLHISKDEQKQRLQSRLDNPAKHWKFNPDDLKDRSRWSEFMGAYGDLLSKTSKENSPWYVIPSDRKWYRNIVITQIIVEHLNQLQMSYPKPDWEPGSFILE